MRDADAIARLQALLGEALYADDPVAFVRTRAAEPGADPALAAIDADGLRIAALLVAKLRFQRLLNGSKRAGEWFEHDAAAFTAAFRRYHREVAPTAIDPWREAAAFDAWQAKEDPGPDRPAGR